MKVLIITYYWPPSGGSGVQRWLKFVKHLSGLGVDCVVYTVKDPIYAIEDNSLVSEVPENVEVLQGPIWEPNKLLAKFSKKEKDASAGFLDSEPSFFQRQLQYIRANYFIPDARKFWIKPSVKRLSEYLDVHKVDLVISSGPPHSVHLIAEELKQKFNLKWVSDFRDPWTNIDYFQKLPLNKASIEKHKMLEKRVVSNSDAVLVVGNSMKEEFVKFNTNIHVVPNGFDEVKSESEVVLDQAFSISHIGLMNADRNPELLWKVLSEKSASSKEFAKDLKIKLIGKCAQEVYQSIDKHGLHDMVEELGYVPHSEVLDYQRSSQLLLLLVNKVPSAKKIVTGKVFEYMQSKRPILAIGPVDGDLAAILRNTGSGVIVDFDDVDSLNSVIDAYYVKFKKGQLDVDASGIASFNRKNLTKDLLQILKSI